MNHYPFFDHERAALIRDICACLGVPGIAGASPIAREIAAQAVSDGELMERAIWLTGMAAEEIRALAACSPLCFADFVATLQITPPVITPLAPAQRVVKFGDAMICTVCQLDARYCRGHAPPDAMSNDAARADRVLAQRIKDCQGK